jgi:hypothetical protein
MTTIVPLDPEKLRLKIDPQSLGFQQLSQLETEERPLVAQEGSRKQGFPNWPGLM